MSNKQIGNSFEQEFAKFLSEHGFYAHVIAQRSEGQPADIIAAKNKKPYLIDCKVCSTDRGFDLSRIEENQDLAMELWKDCGNGEGWFAVKLSDQVYMIPHFTIRAYRNQQATMTPKDIFECGKKVEQWLRCK